MDELQAIIERIVCEAEEAGCTVARFSSPRFKGQELTLVGKQFARAPGRRSPQRWTT